MANQKIKPFAFVFLFLLVVAFATAGSSSFGVKKVGSTIDLPQSCASCTYNNITAIEYPNGTSIYLESTMTKNGQKYNYTYTFPDNLQGEYFISGHGDLNGVDTGWRYSIELTSEGKPESTSNSLFYLGLLGVLVLFLVVILGSISFIPSTDEYNSEGDLLNINNLKHLRPILWGVVYVLVMAIMFLSSNIAFAYLGTKMMGNILFTIYRIMFSLLLPMMVLWLIYIFRRIFLDKETKKMIERGINVKANYV